MIASAAERQLSGFRSATHAGIPATMRSTGRGSMMTPVENGRTWRRSQPSARATALQVVRARAMPSLPVPALALPVLTTSARTRGRPARCSFATTTGAAQKRLRVKTPATRLPSASRIRSRSRRPGLRISAAAVPNSTPRTARNDAGSGGARLTAILAKGEEGKERIRSGECREPAPHPGRLTSAFRGSACTSFRSRTDRDRCDLPCPSRA